MIRGENSSVKLILLQQLQLSLGKQWIIASLVNDLNETKWEVQSANHSLVEAQERDLTRGPITHRFKL